MFNVRQRDRHRFIDFLFLSRRRFLAICCAVRSRSFFVKGFHRFAVQFSRGAFQLEHFTERFLKIAAVTRGQLTGLLTVDHNRGWVLPTRMRIA